MRGAFGGCGQRACSVPGRKSLITQSGDLAFDRDEIEIRRSPQEMPGLLVTPVPDTKTVKNRLHIDLRPDDQESEVERLVNMGARPVDIGQHDVGWVVLADPEGNEFCVLSSS